MVSFVTTTSIIVAPIKSRMEIFFWCQLIKVHLEMAVKLRDRDDYCYLVSSFRPLKPRAGSGVVRMDPLRFLAGCRTRRLNQA